MQCWYRLDESKYLHLTWYIDCLYIVYVIASQIVTDTDKYGNLSFACLRRRNYAPQDQRLTSLCKAPI